jgi:hypothetical protein
VGAYHRHHPVRQWQLATMTGALTSMMLVVVITVGHLEQEGKAG